MSSVGHSRHVQYSVASEDDVESCQKEGHGLCGTRRRGTEDVPHLATQETTSSVYVMTDSKSTAATGDSPAVATAMMRP